MISRSPALFLLPDQPLTKGSTMSNPYQQQPFQAPKRLERSRSNKVVGGVCGGVAQYINMDPTLVRVLTVVLSLFTGVPIIVYLVAMFALPEEGTQPPYPVNPPQYDQQGYGQDAYGQPAYGQPGATAWTPTGEPQAAPVPPAWGAAPAAPASATDPVWGANGAPWDQPVPPAQAAADPAPQDPSPAEPEAHQPSGPSEPTTDPASDKPTDGTSRL